ncbi:heavy metal sensor histidine kinase [Photobacterium sp. SDRW27]|uniref:heavy metal sensor histidine kinase n=1 Tax=Photobacterium obscurum TaxID=2829490 RepID=UPI0022448D88|nr:heavy metal sensor histidine kinase [Photobacterium obscurum]MCW8331383.1 heavy metal sensor histidine kinase [Photobacterium obscurum]
MLKSLSSRLIISFVTASILVLCALSTVTLYSLKHHFFQQDKYNLDQKFQTINTLKLQDDFISKYGTIFELGETNLWLVKNDTVTYQTKPIELPDDFIQNPEMKNVVWQNNENHYRAFRYQVNDEPKLDLVLGININHHLSFLKSFSNVLILTTLLASMISGFLGWLIVKKGLLPLQKLKQHMRQTSTERLNLRLEPTHFPTELQQLVVVFNEMLSRLENEFERLSEFSSDIAHELRTPISNMMTQTQVMLAHPRSVAEYQDSLISTTEELNRLTKTITDMLYLAKSEHNLLQISNVDFQLDDLLESVVEYYELAGDEKGLLLELTGKAVVHGDKDMLKRAIGNLISNAVRHSDENEKIKIQILNNESSTTVSVINKGDTIPESDLPHLFERFYRADKARSHRACAGAGLGLAISRSIAKCHHGDIFVSSENGYTCFSLTIPNRATLNH